MNISRFVKVFFDELIARTLNVTVILLEMFSFSYRCILSLDSIFDHFFLLFLILCSIALNSLSGLSLLEFSEIVKETHCYFKLDKRAETTQTHTK